MRIGIVCPYSLSLPGGVQNQVLSLARSLRRRGHEVRVLAPCDGPPPELFVIPVGKSLPTAANGSVARVASATSAAERVVGRLGAMTFSDGFGPDGTGCVREGKGFTRYDASTSRASPGIACSRTGVGAVTETY